MPELLGTAVLLLLGVGVVANATLPRTGGNGGGPLMIHFGWGLAVFAGVYVATISAATLWSRPWSTSQRRSPAV